MQREHSGCELDAIDRELEAEAAATAIVLTLPSAVPGLGGGRVLSKAARGARALRCTVCGLACATGTPIAMLAPAARSLRRMLAPNACAAYEFVRCTLSVWSYHVVYCVACARCGLPD